MDRVGTELEQVEGVHDAVRDVSGPGDSADVDRRCEFGSPGERSRYGVCPRDSATEERRAGVPMQRYGTSHEIAATISFLVSDGAAYITGQNLRVDGGLMRSIS